MPRESSSKRPTGSKPYPKSTSFSAAQTEKIAKAFMLALNTISDDDNDNDEQTTFSEDEQGPQEEEEQATTPVTLSSSSSDTTLLHAALAPLEATLQESSEMLRKLPAYLGKFVTNKNAEGIEKATALLVRHEAIVTDTEAKIASLKDSWAAEERAKQQAAKEAQQRELERKEAAKSKGKATAARIEGKSCPLPSKVFPPLSYLTSRSTTFSTACPCSFSSLGMCLYPYGTSCLPTRHQLPLLPAPVALCSRHQLPLLSGTSCFSP
jgi:hypothetical protein